MGDLQANWPLYEVFIRGKRGLNHVHVGSLHAADDEMALHHARDLYTRRNEGVSIWVVRASAITASSPDEKDAFFAPSGDKVYRHPTFYAIPDDVPHMMNTHLHADDNVYDSLAEAEGGEERWAFGTGFDDPLAGVDTTVPDGVDAAALARQCLALGDDALVLSQRLALWCSNVHELEDEVALANIALDLLGQARLLLTRAAQADPSIRPPRAPSHIPHEDALAYFRDEGEFTNVRLAERADEGDFARCVARLLVLITWRMAYMSQLTSSPDPVLAAIAAKALVEMTYHREYAAGWVVRLGDGTELSRTRMQAAIDWAWPDLDELFVAGGMREESYGVLRAVLAAATLTEPPTIAGEQRIGGRMGSHTHDLDALLADLQDFARANPDATW